MAKPRTSRNKQRGPQITPGLVNPVRLEGALGASDANSGGGAGSGTPDADTEMRPGGQYSASPADVRRDREKLFPETVHRTPPGPAKGTHGPSRKNPRATPRSHRRSNAK